MPLKIGTFSNTKGGNAVFKALSHPLATPKTEALIAKLTNAKSLALYDPHAQAGDFDAIYGIPSKNLTGVYVQDMADLGKTFLTKKTEPVTALPGSGADTVFICAFDADRIAEQIRHLLPKNATILTLDSLRIPDDLHTNKRKYIDPLNFATNFALFREENGHHTRIVTANYWAGYGAKNTFLWLRLYDDKGEPLAEWREDLSTGTHMISIDSREVRARFKLKPFTGSLFIHAVNVAGHDVVKYALDTYGDDPKILSCTHDANAWPADFYAGLPAPKKGERVLLWVQNSSPRPIPANEVGVALMGANDYAHYPAAIPSFGACAIDISTLLPQAAWPQQLEVQAGRYFVRPRYEVVAANGRQRIAHVNVERTDLKPDPAIPGLSNLMGKGYLLPAPILPLDRWRSIALPTPMATGQDNLPLALIIYDASGNELLRHFLGKLDRSDSIAIDAGDLLKQHGHTDIPGGFGHMELVYDFAQGGSADGWLHALFRYEDSKTGHAAETSFGGHIFNTVMVYKNEPQSYTGQPPGLSTRLFLRLGHDGADALCHLIYPASTPWHPESTTDLLLFDAHGAELSKKTVHIPCSGSLLWRASEQFTPSELKPAAYIMIRDTTCRLFGYHGLINGEAFSLDHMFGF